MENKEIMERLLQEDKPTSQTIQNEASEKKANGEATISKVRVVTAKYKMYIVLLLLFICLFLLSWIPSIQSKLSANEEAYKQANTKLINIENDIEVAKKDIAYLCDEKNGVISNENNLKNYLNKEGSCSSLPSTRMTGSGEETDCDVSIPLSYLQLHSLYNKKMPVDEKIVLKNLNEYLIKQNISGGDRNRVGDILRINIGDPEAVEGGDEHFFQVPVDVEIEFADVKDLIEFLYNVEKRMIENSKDRILYKIQSVSYDIVTNDEPQITDISMIAYYYHDEKFNDKSECNSADENPTNTVDTNEEADDGAESDSFFQEIFNKIKK